MMETDYKNTEQLFKNEEIQKAYEVLDAHLKKANINIWDLFKPLKAEQEKPKEIVGWVNMYISQEINPKYVALSSNAYRFKFDADKESNDNRIACIYVKFQEGEGLR